MCRFFVNIYCYLTIQQKINKTNNVFFECIKRLVLRDSNARLTQNCLINFLPTYIPIVTVYTQLEGIGQWNEYVN